MVDTYQVSIVINGNDKGATAAVDKLKRGLQGAEAETRNMGSASRGLSMDMGSLQRQILGAATAFGAMGALEVLSQFNEIGVKANAVSDTFDALTGDANLDEMMRGMREQTGGIINDITLMDGANKLLMTGLAETGDEAARFIEIATKLGGAMGQDAASSIENFNGALLNMSFERLDSLGISASNVRERMAELKEQGIETNEAFKMAVLEASEDTLGRLGSAADTSETSLARLQTRIDNFKMGAMQGVADLVDAIATNLEQIIEADRRYWEEHQRGVDEAREEVQRELDRPDAFSQINQTLNADNGAMLGREFGGAFISEMMGAIESSPDLSDRDILANSSFGVELAMDDADEYLAAVGAIRTQLGVALSTQEYINYAYERGSEILEGQQWIIEHSAAARERAAAAMEAESMNARTFGSADQAAQQLNTLSGGDRTLFSPDELAEAEQLVRMYEQAVEEMEQLGVSDEQIDTYRELNDEVGRMADEVRKGAAAYDALDDSLANLLGQSQGGAMGEIGDRVTGLLEERGVDPAQLTDLSTAFGLSSGEITEQSQDFEQNIVPMIADIWEQHGEDAAIAAAEAYERGMMNASLTGDMPDVPSMMTGFGRMPDGSLFDMGIAGQTVASEEGGIGRNNWQDVMGGNAAMIPDFAPLEMQMDSINTDAVSWDAAMATVRGNADTLVATLPEVAGSAKDLASHFDEADESVSHMKSLFDDLTANPVVVRIKLVPDGAQSLAVLNAIGMGGSLSTTVRNNGGRVPGADRVED